MANQISGYFLARERRIKNNQSERRILAHGACFRRGLGCPLLQQRLLLLRRKMEELDESVPVGEELQPCKVCGRNFYPGVLKKHMLICQKVTVRKRKVFDSSRQRAEGTEIPSVKPLKPKPEAPKKPSSWRRKHEEFIATIRAAKGLSQVMKDGGPLPPPPPPSYDPDYIQCPYCQRRFSENAAERHIKFCKEQAARITNKGKFPGNDKVKPPAKTQYKPVPLKKATPATSTSPASLAATSRLPQRPAAGQSGGTGIPGMKSPAGSVRNIPASFSPSRSNTGGVTSPPSGSNTKPKGVVAPNSLKSTSYAGGTNKKKVYSANNYISRNETKNDDAEVDFSTQGTKFCHECGTKYPVDWAKFCCECGVRRMCI